MLSFLFRTRHRLTTDLAVERVRRELAEQDCARLRDELRTLQTEYAQFRDQAFARAGLITAPVTEASASSRSPRVSVFDALAVTEIGGPPPHPVMPAVSDE